MGTLRGAQLHSIHRMQEGFQTYGYDLLRTMLGMYLLFGLLVIDDYGISMDEPIQRKHGIISFEYVNKYLGLSPQTPPTRDDQLRTYDHRDYGVFFQMVSYGAERLLGIQSAKNVFLLRHILVFLLFWVACYCFSQILYLRYQRWWISLLGTLFLILSPRIFAQAFYNPKDLVFMSWTLISLYTLIKLLRYKNFKNAVIHGLVCAFAINARITGVFIPVVSCLMIGLLIWGENLKIQKFSEEISWITSFIIATILFTYLLWPFLWEDPISNFQYAFNSMKRYDWSGNVWYLGSFVKATHIPWHYGPVLIGVTTPILYIFFFLIGFLHILPKCIAWVLRHSINEDTLIDLSTILFLLAPFTAIIVFQSVLYHGWRHLYFIYPPILIISVYGIVTTINYVSNFDSLQAKKMGYISIIVLISLGVSHTLYSMIRLHPHQQVYFNELVGREPHKQFEMDYYGLSYKQALSYLLTTHPNKPIKVYVTSNPGEINKVNFTQEEMNRLEYVSISEADYLISNFHFPARTQMYFRYLEGKFPFNHPEIFNIKAKNSRIISIYDIR